MKSPAEGETVGDCARKQLTSNYPALREQLFQGDALQRYVNVYVNDEDIQYLQKLAHAGGAERTPS